MNRYPHTGTILHYGAMTYSAVGVPSAGTLNTLAVHCNVQPNKARQVVGEDGNLIQYDYNVYCPLVTATIADPNAIKFQYGGKTYKGRLFNYQRHTELQVWVA